MQCTVTNVWAFCSDNFLLIAPGRRGCLKKLMFVMMVIISVILSMEHLGRDVI
jgi:hypothetical protein